MAKKLKENAENFTDLGFELLVEGDVETDVNTRQSKAVGMFRQLNIISRSSTFNLNTKLKLYMFIVDID